MNFLTRFQALETLSFSIRIVFSKRLLTALDSMFWTQHDPLRPDTWVVPLEPCVVHPRHGVACARVAPRMLPAALVLALPEQGVGLGNDACWRGGFSFEDCCKGRGRPECFDALRLGMQRGASRRCWAYDLQGSLGLMPVNSWGPRLNCRIP